MTREEILAVVDTVINAAAIGNITPEHISAMQKISDDMMAGEFDDFDEPFFKKLQVVLKPMRATGLIR
jgi:hypothetical protein